MNTVSFSEKNKGWISFQSWEPDAMGSLNNSFYTVKNGNLYLHNAKNVGRNLFYNTQHKSKVITIFNASPQDDKIFKTLVLEGTHPWDVVLSTNYTEGTIDKDEFLPKESRWVAYIRQNEDTDDLNGNAAQGIGNLVSIASETLTFTSTPEQTSIGDALYLVDNGTPDIVGFITAITETTITIDSVITAPTAGMFMFSKKPSRIEGSEIRGYYLEVSLENELATPTELFAVNTNAVKSYV